MDWKIEFRSDLSAKIVDVANRKALTHSEVARLAHTSRTRVTAILNRNTEDILTDLMLRVLASLVYKQSRNSRALLEQFTALISVL